MSTKKKRDSKECPLCMENLEVDDLHFFPCTCKYQVCRFCWNRIITSENGLCPACRRPYNSEEPALFQPMTTDEIKQIKRKQKNKSGVVDESRKDLTDKRVLQENLLFIINLPTNMPRDEELLKSDLYFGKYGTVVKAVVNQTQVANNSTSSGVYTSAYVTYRDKWNAMIALLDINAQGLNGMRSLKVSFGTTKYCAQFLKGQSCPKKECMYLHQKGDEKASFTKEDMANGKHSQYEAELIQQFRQNLDPTVLPEDHFFAPKPAPKPLLECEILGSLSGDSNSSSCNSGRSPTVEDTTTSAAVVLSHLETINSNHSSVSSSTWSNHHQVRSLLDNNLSAANNSNFELNSDLNNEAQHHEMSFSSGHNSSIQLASHTVQSSPSGSDAVVELSASKYHNNQITLQSYSSKENLSSSFVSTNALSPTNANITHNNAVDSLYNQPQDNNNSSTSKEVIPSTVSSGNVGLSQRQQRTLSDEDSAWLLDMVSDNLSSLQRLALEEEHSRGSVYEPQTYYPTSNDSRFMRSLSLGNGTQQHYTTGGSSSSHFQCAPPPGFDNGMVTRSNCQTYSSNDNRQIRRNNSNMYPNHHTNNKDASLASMRADFHPHHSTLGHIYHMPPQMPSHTNSAGVSQNAANMDHLKQHMMQSTGDSVLRIGNSPVDFLYQSNSFNYQQQVSDSSYGRTSVDHDDPAILMSNRSRSAYWQTEQPGYYASRNNSSANNGVYYDSIANDRIGSGGAAFHSPSSWAWTGNSVDGDYNGVESHPNNSSAAMDHQQQSYNMNHPIHMSHMQPQHYLTTASNSAYPTLYSNGNSNSNQQY